MLRLNLLNISSVEKTLTCLPSNSKSICFSSQINKNENRRKDEINIPINLESVPSSSTDAVKMQKNPLETFLRFFPQNQHSCTPLYRNSFFRWKYLNHTTLKSDLDISHYVPYSPCDQKEIAKCL